MRRTVKGVIFKGEWGIPAVYAGVSLAAGIVFPRLEYTLFPKLIAPVSAGAAMAFYSAIASGMITLTGIVFSFTFVMVQFSATAYSPRLVQWISRDPVISHSLGVFTATFLYAIAALMRVDLGGQGKVPFISGWIVVALLLVSTAMFIGLIRRISLLRVDRMLVFTGDMGRAVIAEGQSSMDAPPAADAAASIRKLPVCQTLVHAGHPSIVQAIDTEALVRLAADAGGVIELVAGVGDSVVEGRPLLRVRNAAAQIGEAKLRGGILVGRERTFEQDPKYALRLLVDIAIKALSPAINDPTTAVQALDQIEDLLTRIGKAGPELGIFNDERGEVRLLVRPPDWEDTLSLAFSEIASCGATSVQVMRRMNAMLTDLADALPASKRVALEARRSRLARQIERNFSDVEERAEALREDRQGLGATRKTHDAACAPPAAQ